MTIRAERHADTHRRIVNAAARLFRTQGPDRTSFSDIARTAGVEPPTVVRHFPDRLSLIMACLLPGFEQDPPPDFGAWTQVQDPEARLRRALSEMYPYYRRNRVFATVLYDERNVEFAAVREAGRPMWDQVHRILADGWPVPESARGRLLKALVHVFSLWTWVSLADQGLADDEGAELMLEMVRGTVTNMQTADPVVRGPS